MPRRSKSAAIPAIPGKKVKARGAGRKGYRATKEVSVMVWIENQFGDVLLLRQGQGSRLWTLPGGKVRVKESLNGALRREVLEETGLKIQSIVPWRLFDRPEKGVLTFLFAARIRGRNDAVHPHTREIEAAKFSGTLPRNATPSLKFFWRSVREGDGGRF